MINFKVSDSDAKLIQAIINRVISKQVEVDALGLEMDITACHANGCPLRLEELLQAGAFDFYHDLNGIQKNLNRTTGKLENFFCPRYAVPS